MRIQLFGIAAAFALLFNITASSARQQAKPIMWLDPGNVADKDLRWGAGSADRQPAPPFTFLKEDLSGTKPKVRVTDKNGVTWNIKLAGPREEKNEVHAELAANRIVSALGYCAEEDYFVREGKIEQLGTLGRAKSAIGADGSFQSARFERRDDSVEHSHAHWLYDDNPFVGTKELSGLQILLVLLNNWDNRSDNTAIDRIERPDGTFEDCYLVSDWGASFGLMSGRPNWSPAPTRWRLDDYKRQPLTRGVADGTLKLEYAGQHPIDGVPVEHARWFAELASRLRPEQVRAAFAAAGASPDEANGFAARLLEKIEELRSAVQSSPR